MRSNIKGLRMRDAFFLSPVATVPVTCGLLLTPSHVSGGDQAEVWKPAPAVGQSACVSADAHQLEETFLRILISSWATEPWRQALWEPERSNGLELPLRVRACREIRKPEPTAHEEESKFQSRLLASIDLEAVEDGYSHPAEAIIEEAFAVSGEAAERWTESIVVSAGPASAAAVLKCLGRLDSPGSERWRVDLIRNALISPDVEVRDAAVQGAELWGSEALAGVLKAHSEKVPWLADYIRRVICDIQ